MTFTAWKTSRSWLRLCSTALLLFNFPCNLSTAHASIDAAADTLWRQGSRAFGQGNYTETVKHLSQLVDHHPGADHHLDANYLLGISYLRTGQAEAALKPLRRYVDATHVSSDSLRARLLLGDAYAQTKRSHEALLIAQEVLERSGRRQLWRELGYEALLHKARALLLLGEDARALRSVDSFETAVPKGPHLLRPFAGYIRTELKLRECARLPTAHVLDESEARTQLNRRGQCLIEALVRFREALLQGDDSWTLASRESVLEGYAQFRDACSHPPDPPGTRSALELKRYRQELTDRILTDCQTAVEEAQRHVTAWETTLAPGIAYHATHMNRSLKDSHAIRTP